MKRVRIISDNSQKHRSAFSQPGVLLLLVGLSFGFVQNPAPIYGQIDQEKRGLGARPTSKTQSSTVASSRRKPDLVLQTGHVGRVLDVAFTSDSRRLVSCGDRIRVWDVATGRQIRTFGGAVNIEISPDGSLMASSESDKKIRLWNTENWEEVKTLAYPDRSEDFRADDLRFSADGRILIALSAGGDALLWEIATGRLLGFINDKARGGIAFSPDSRWLVTITGYEKEAVFFDVATAREVSASSLSAHLLAMSRDNKLAKLDASDSRNIVVGSSAHGDQKLSGHTEAVKAITFSPDGSKLASGSFDKTVKLWDVASGRELRTFSGHAFFITAVNFSSDGKLLVSADSNTTKVWDASSGREIASLDTSNDRSEARYLSLTPDKRWVIRGAPNRVVFWEQATGKKIASDIIVVARRPYVTSPDGQWRAYPQEGRIELSNTSTRESKNLVGYPPGFQKVSFSRDGRWLAWASDRVHSNNGDDSVRIWEAATGQMFQRVRVGGARNLAFSPDGKSLAVGNVSDAQILDVMGGKKLLTVHPRDGYWIDGVDFSPDGKWLASSRDEVKVWETTTGREVLTVKPGFRFSSFAFNLDWRLLAMAELGAFEPQNKITIWDAQTGTKLRELPANYYREGVVTFSPDGRILASGGNGEVIKLWDAATGNVIRAIAANHGTFGSQLVFSPDGRLLASAGADGVVRLWDVATGREFRALAAHAGSVNGLAFHPEGQLLASSSSDGSIIIWEIATGQQLALLTAIRNSNDWLVVTPDGLFDGSSQGMAKLVAWRFANDEVAPLEILFNEFYYPGLLAEILAGRRPKASRNILDIDRRQPRIALKLVDPQSSDKAAISTRNVKLSIDITEAASDADHPTGSGAHDLRLFRNGSLVKVWRGDVLAGRTGKVILEATVPIVAGENRLSAYAFNRDNIKSSDATLTVTGAESLRRKGVAYVLAVGVNEYANAQYNLKYAVADADGFAEEVKRQQTKLSQYERVEIVSLNDKAATKANVLKSLTDLSVKIQPEDAVIIFFAGHGTAQGNRFYLIPHDLGYSGSRTQLESASLQNILSHSISDEELERAVEAIDAGQFVLVIDACNSGQALEAEEKRRGPMNSKGLAQLAYEKGMYILTAAQSYQAALEASKLGHGYLTYALVEEGLKSNAADREPRDGQVLLREWLDYATNRVPQMQDEELVGKRQLVQQGNQKNQASEVQRPRVFYRREVETKPLVVAKP